MNTPIQCVAFDGTRRIASGKLPEVTVRVQKHGSPSTLIFDDSTSELIETVEDSTGIKRCSLRKTEPATGEARAPGRPKLGVIAREVTLLPRHWDWLNLQPGGASVALRRLVEEARRVNRDSDRVRLAQESAYRFMSALAGNEEGFEEAIRGLFAGDANRFAQHCQTWPEDVREHAARLAARAFEGSESQHERRS